MAHSILLGTDQVPTRPAGRDVKALGPSDTSDSGADMQAQLDLEEAEEADQQRVDVAPGEDSLQQEMQAADSDSTATGERASAVESEDLRDNGDIAPDRVFDARDKS